MLMNAKVAANLDIDIFEGSTFFSFLTFLDENNDPIDLTNETLIELYVYHCAYEQQRLFELSLGDGITVDVNVLMLEKYIPHGTFEYQGMYDYKLRIGNNNYLFGKFNVSK